MAQRPAATGRVRIIGGDWRGRSVRVPDGPGLRPTPDRVRETLFNWIQRHIAGRAVADLFGGSGALGFEAASRGAASVTIVERDRQARAQLHANALALAAGAVNIVRGDALDWLPHVQTPLDGVFIDPPYHHGLQAKALALLRRPGVLSDSAWVYLESAADEAVAWTPGCWEVSRDKRHGGVRARLLRPTRRSTASP